MIRSHRHPGDSCRSCVELDGKWFPMGDPAYTPVGQRECRTSCRCDEETGMIADGGEIAGFGVDSF